jgi:hypothetical protein
MHQIIGDILNVQVHCGPQIWVLESIMQGGPHAPYNF